MHSLDMYSVSAIVLAEIRQSAKIWSVSGVGSIEGLPGLVTSSVLKSPHWRWVHQVFTVEYDRHLSLSIFCSKHSWISFRNFFFKNRNLMIVQEFHTWKFHIFHWQDSDIDLKKSNIDFLTIQTVTLWNNFFFF